jgi:UDP-N-acetylglucosamine 2-epimerase (non-hydrolysing)
MKIINVVGARPNFMKIAPIHSRMLRSASVKPVLVHTGQHYDDKMSKVFLTISGCPIRTYTWTQVAGHMLFRQRT